MKYKVTFVFDGLPRKKDGIGVTEAFGKLPAECNLLFEGGSRSCLRTRDGNSYDVTFNNAGLDSTGIVEFDDFVPGMKLDDNPEWYADLKDRIVSVQAQEKYGPAQGIRVTEETTHGCAVARVRHQQAYWGRNGELVFVVKIRATGPEALRDARALHNKILTGNK